MNTNSLFDRLPIDTAHLVPLKPISRKSEEQAHTWFLCDPKGPVHVVKLGLDGRQSSVFVGRETLFFRTIESAKTLPLTQKLPPLVSSGRLDIGPFLVTGYCDLELSHRWIPRHMKTALPKVIAWQSAILEWLARFQQDHAIREAFGVPAGQVISHGDFNHFNILGSGKSFAVIDWENWSFTEHPFLDALHLLVLPTLCAGSPQEQADSFQSYWNHETPYRAAALVNLSPFIGKMDWREAMKIYLSHQEDSLSGHAPEIAKTFELCLTSITHR